MKPTIIDFSEQIAKAKTSTVCDNCGKQLGDSYPRGRDSMAMHLKDGQDSDGYDKYTTHHACGEDCMHGILQKRQDAKKKV